MDIVIWYVPLYVPFALGGDMDMSPEKFCMSPGTYVLWFAKGREGHGKIFCPSTQGSRGDMSIFVVPRPATRKGHVRFVVPPLAARKGHAQFAVPPPGLRKGHALQ